MPTDYFQEIESHFIRRRGTPFVLNAKDWVLMQKWSAEGIPLPIVIEAIDAVFDKHAAAGSKKAVNGLSFCRHAVKELWQERRELQVGAGSNTPEEAPGLLLDALAARLESSGHDLVRAYGVRVRELAVERSVPRIEERLIELEEELLSSILTSTAEAESLRTEAAAIDLARVDEKTRARTIEANLRRLVRERFQVPRLTLF